MRTTTATRFRGSIALWRTMSGANRAVTPSLPSYFPWILGRYNHHSLMRISHMRSFGWAATCLDPLSLFLMAHNKEWPLSLGSWRILTCLDQRLWRSGVVTSLSCSRYDHIIYMNIVLLLVHAYMLVDVGTSNLNPRASLFSIRSFCFMRTASGLFNLLPLSIYFLKMKF